MSNNIFGDYNSKNKISVKETQDLNQNFPIIFVEKTGTRPQNP